MDHLARYLIFLSKFLLMLSLANAATYSVKVGTDQHVNEVDSRFLSFTVDPRYLFSSREKYDSKECLCMASSLTPAYIRIAGPSTSHMTFRNASITFTDLDAIGLELDPNKVNQTSPELAVTTAQWRQFVQWAKSTGFDLVFALNNEEKTGSGLWDPNSALNILTVAEKADIGEIFWQLGYECKNQSIEDYLDDLQTLRVIMETFSPGRAREWRAVGGDVTPCLQAHSTSDFKDYVTLSEDLMDAVLLNGNSSAQELERMSDASRLQLLQLLSTSKTPLWLTETPDHFSRRDQLPSELQRYPEAYRRLTASHQHLPERPNEIHRAVDWMTSLGYSARNGFVVHFRELVKEELYEPTLSFYMALLFKNLVGERVLDVEMDPTQAVLFAHCTSLRHKPVPGAVTLYGANLDDETARFSIKLSKREEGGDIMQFILGHDHSGNIMVNGRALYYEGDIRPVVKRVRPYKTLLLNLPPKSFGFWVLANTNIEACYNVEDKNTTKTDFIEDISVIEADDETETSNVIKTKRSDTKQLEIDEHNIIHGKGDAHEKHNEITAESESLKQRVKSLNKDLKNIQKNLEDKSSTNVLSRSKRQIFDRPSESRKGKFRRQFPKHNVNKNKAAEDGPKTKLFIIRKLLGLKDNILNSTRLYKQHRGRKITGISKSKLNKRNSKKFEANPVKNYLEGATSSVEDVKLRRRRSLLHDTNNLSTGSTEGISSENEVDIDDVKNMKLWDIFHKIHEQLNDLPDEEDGNINPWDKKEESEDVDQIVVKTKLSDDGTTINYSEKSNNGLIKSTIESGFTVLSDINKNLNKIWNTLRFLE